MDGGVTDAFCLPAGQTDRGDRMDLKGRKVLVFGAGRSGIGSTKLLLDAGAEPVLYDGNEKLDVSELRKSFPEEKEFRIVTGPLPEDLIREVSLLILSPGVPTDLQEVVRIREMGVPIWGEVELAYQLSQGELLAITGTNGKTTTVTLLGEIMKNALGEDRVFVVGNIGSPYTGAAFKTREDSVSVAEISSFQLESIHRFHPHVSAITNITPDHLNRHHSMEEYIRVKERIAENQTLEDVLILNYEDGILRDFGERVKDRVRVLWFSSERPLPSGMYLEDGVLKIRKESGEIVQVIHTDELALLGKHNYENVSAAVLAALSAGVSLPVIQETLRSFKSVEHRIEYVDEVDGVAYYNDSKGTNPDAAIKAVQAMRRPTVLIGGGYDKDSAYDAWIESFDGKVKALVLIGATREKIASCARAHGFENLFLCDSFEEAFEKSVSLAEKGDAVLLSPACASWGMFRN